MHRSTETTPFELVLSRPPPPLLALLLHEALRSGHPHHVGYLKAQLHNSIHWANRALQRSQTRYKHEFEKRVRRVSLKLRQGDYVYLNTFDGSRHVYKLEPTDPGTFRVNIQKRRTDIINQNVAVERIYANRIVYAQPPRGAHENRSEHPLLTKQAELHAMVCDSPRHSVDRIDRDHLVNGKNQVPRPLDRQRYTNL